MWRPTPRPASCPRSWKPSSKAETVGLIDDFGLPRGAIPTQWLNEVEVWDALLQWMPLTALVRNLDKKTAVGLVKPFSAAANLVIRKLGDGALLKRARIQALAASEKGPCRRFITRTIFGP